MIVAFLRAQTSQHLNIVVDVCQENGNVLLAKNIAKGGKDTVTNDLFQNRIVKQKRELMNKCVHCNTVITIGICPTEHCCWRVWQ